MTAALILPQVSLLRARCAERKVCSRSGAESTWMALGSRAPDQA